MSDRFAKTLQVYSNPWHALDHKGRPCGAVPVGDENGPVRAWVGASLDSEITRVTLRRTRGDIRSDVQVTVFRFKDQPVTVKRTEHYLRAIRDGALIAADKLTATFAGVAFEEPKAKLEAARERAIAKFDSDYGAGAWEFLQEDRDADVPMPAATEVSA